MIKNMIPNQNKKHTGYLIGQCVTYSYSKIIHESLNKDLTYQLKSFNEEELINFINQKNYDFVNITNPYKALVIPYLDYLDETVIKTKVCNLIINKNNKLYGYNTDTIGFEQSLKYDYTSKFVLILGTGSTSKSVYHIISQKTNKVTFATREKTNINKHLYNYQDLDLIKDQINLIINTTPNGTDGTGDNKLINLKSFTNIEYVYDVVYNPYRTNLLLEADKLKIPHQNGLQMLINQAWLVYQNNLLDYPINHPNLNLIKQRLLNLTLIGMPSSGKTTISKLLNQKYHKILFDTDKEIENKYNIKIKDYLNPNTETRFRKMEEDLILQTKIDNMIISTGGGMIMNETIMNKLKKVSLIIYLELDLDTYLNQYTIDDNHPLIKSKEDLINLYHQRHDKYLAYADIVINNNNLNQTIELIGELVDNYEK